MPRRELNAIFRVLALSGVGTVTPAQRCNVAGPGVVQVDQRISGVNEIPDDVPRFAGGPGARCRVDSRGSGWLAAARGLRIVRARLDRRVGEIIGSLRGGERQHTRIKSSCKG